MPSLADLNLTDEATPEVDWSAPESGSFPPAVGPGTYTLMFELPEKRDDWFDKMEVAVGKDANGQDIKKAFLVLVYNPKLVGDKDGNPYTPPEGGELPHLGYQRASFYKHEKMLISQGAELLRALGAPISGPMTPAAIEAAVQGLDKRVTFKGEVIWRTYFKDTETTISTAPRKKTKRGPEVKWPQEADGTFSVQVSNPRNPNSQKQYGRCEINRVHAATA